VPNLVQIIRVKIIVKSRGKNDLISGIILLVQMELWNVPIEFFMEFFYQSYKFVLIFTRF